ncbi:hypothetical protein RSK20926_05547 [Roseobacter sp. SK209-2-6]|nr:hypothetical protein RSK20926_05547 [Roseobacter sp. SK209-2-6]
MAPKKVGFNSVHLAAAPAAGTRLPAPRRERSAPARVAAHRLKPAETNSFKHARDRKEQQSARGRRPSRKSSSGAFEAAGSDSSGCDVYRARPYYRRQTFGLMLAGRGPNAERPGGKKIKILCVVEQVLKAPRRGPL